MEKELTHRERQVLNLRVQGKSFRQIAEGLRIRRQRASELARNGQKKIFTSEEIQVFNLMILRKTRKEISQELKIDLESVKKHETQILKKLGFVS